MKNGFIPEKPKSQEEVFQSSERKTEINQENLFSTNLENKEANSQVLNTSIKQESKFFFNQGNSQSSSSFISLTSIEIKLPSDHKKKKHQSLRRKKKRYWM